MSFQNRMILAGTDAIYRGVDCFLSVSNMTVAFERNKPATKVHLVC
jgi:hypothetical protein